MVVRESLSELFGLMAHNAAIDMDQQMHAQVQQGSEVMPINLPTWGTPICQLLSERLGALQIFIEAEATHNDTT